MADGIATLISALGLTQETFLAFCVIALLVVGAVVVIITSRPILDIYPYLNPSARVRARKGRLFDEKQISEIVRLAPKEVKDPFVIMSKKSDIDNIKSLLTAKEVGLNGDETRELLIPCGSLYAQLESLADSENVSDIVTSLDGTEYATALEDALPQYESTNMILPLESALDKYYLGKLLRSSDVPADENRQIMYSYVGTQVDVANLKLIIRAKQDGLDYDAVAPYILEEGYQLREWKLKDLMESPDVTNVVSGLEGTKYAEALTDVMPVYNETGSVAVFEKALDVYASNYAKSLSSKKPLGVGPIIGYLSQKENEIKNLKIIARAKREAKSKKRSKLP